MLLRGLIRHCPRCGSGHLFQRWFRMVPACPGCGHRFDRRPEEGFFLGAMTLNIAATEGMLLLVLAAYTVSIGGGHRFPLAVIVPIALAAAVLVPILFYPFSKTLWAAIDLALRPVNAVDDVSGR